MISSIDIGWSAGFLEGEGSFCSSTGSQRVQAGQVQRDPLARLQRLFGGSVSPLRANGMHYWCLYGEKARSVMYTVFALMSPKRRAQIRSALSSWLTSPPFRQHRTHCRHGHPYIGKNLGMHRTTGTRRCLECVRVWNRKNYQKEKAK